MIATYTDVVKRVLTPSSQGLTLETMQKVIDLAGTIDFIGQVNMNLGFSFQTWEDSIVGAEDAIARVFNKFKEAKQVIVSWLDSSSTKVPFPENTLTSDVNILLTLNRTFNSSKGTYSHELFDSICNADLSKCINSFKALCTNIPAYYE